MSEFESVEITRLHEKLNPWGIHLGAASEFPDDPVPFVKVPEEPHVFLCKTLTLLDENRKVIEELHDVMTMLGHGIVKGKEKNERDEDTWIFLGTRYSVSKTVYAYEKAAYEARIAPLDAIIACRPESNAQPPQKVVIRFTRRSIIPYIRADSSATVVNSHPYSAVLTRDEGVSLAVYAQGWSGLNHWKNYWQVNSELRNARNIPDWAKRFAEE